MFGGMRDLANFCGDIWDEIKTRAGSRIKNKQEMDFVIFCGQDARILMEK